MLLTILLIIHVICIIIWIGGVAFVTAVIFPRCARPRGPWRRRSCSSALSIETPAANTLAHRARGRNGPLDFFREIRLLPSRSRGADSVS